MPWNTSISSTQDQTGRRVKNLVDSFGKDGIVTVKGVIMIPNEAKSEWWALQEKYPVLRGWSLEEDRRSKKRLGCCHYSEKVITLSAWLWKWNSENHPQLIDTLRHEAAHVLAGPNVGHGLLWKAHARALGADPRARVRLESVELKNHKKYRATCPICQKVYLAHRRHSNRICPCARSVCFEARRKSILVFTENHVESSSLTV